MKALACAWTLQRLLGWFSRCSQTSLKWSSTIQTHATETTLIREGLSSATDQRLRCRGRKLWTFRIYFCKAKRLSLRRGSEGQPSPSFRRSQSWKILLTLNPNLKLNSRLRKITWNQCKPIINNFSHRHTTSSFNHKAVPRKLDFCSRQILRRLQYRPSMT